MIKKIVYTTLLTSILFLILRWQGAAINSVQYPLGIINFELITNFNEAKLMIALVGKQTLQLNITIDFIFIVSYSMFFFYCCKAIMQYCTTSLLKNIGFVFLEISVLVGVLDLIENIAMLITLGGYGSNTSVLITRLAALSKFALAAIIIGYIFIATLIIKIFVKKKV